LDKIKQASAASDAVHSEKEKENQPPKGKKSGQKGEDENEVEEHMMGERKTTAKKSKQEPLPPPVKEAQLHAMQQSSNFSSGFSSIAESFKPDTAEQFAAKAQAASTLIGSMFVG